MLIVLLYKKNNCHFFENIKYETVGKIDYGLRFIIFEKK